MFTPVSDLLSRSLRRFGIHQQVETVQVLRFIEEILREWFGEDIFRFVQVKYIRGGAIMMASTSSAAAQAIRLRNDELLSKVSEKFPKTAISSLVFLSR